MECNTAWLSPACLQLFAANDKNLDESLRTHSLLLSLPPPPSPLSPPHSPPIPSLSSRLIYDPGTGKPRGFGFCEYEDGETAMSAVRNLAGRELNGRPLRIDSATNAPGEGFRRECLQEPGGLPSAQ